jgi:hypothetical protein
VSIAIRQHRRTVLATVLALATTALAAGSGTDSARASTRLRVLSYNIHHGEGVDGKLDLARIAGAINSVKPDLVALQELLGEGAAQIDSQEKRGTP